MAARPGREPGSYRWYESGAVDYYEVLEGPKIIYPDIAKQPRFYLDRSGVYGTNTIYVFDSGDPYLLGVLNSRLTWFCIGHISIPFGTRQGQFRYRLFTQYMEQLPIPDPAEDDPRRKQLAELAEQLIVLHERVQAAKTGRDKTVLARQIEALDRQVDRLVYDLYDLTDAEVAAIEAAS